MSFRMVEVRPVAARRWLFVTVGHGGVVVLEGPGPRPGPSASCSTRMLRQAPAAGRHREHFTEVTA
jgi:hypothetical protein